MIQKDQELQNKSVAIKGVNCVECKLLHCEYNVSRGVDYQSMPLQCIGLICSQHAIEDLVSQKAPKNPDSNDSSPISISLKT